MAATIPKQLYITFNRRDDGLLGFASPYGTDSAFKKRKITQDGWALNSYSDHETGQTFKYKMNDDLTVTMIEEQHAKSSKHPDIWGWYETPTSVKESPAPVELHPKILDNTLQAGFEVSKSVRRHSSWGNGNVKWQITDPRGFNLEITSPNMARIIDCATIIEGVIQEKCVWGREGANNVLLPETSDIYQAAFVKTSIIDKAIQMKDIPLGSTCEIVNPQAYEAIGVYVGLYHIVMTKEMKEEEGKDFYWGEKDISLINDSIPRHIFKSLKG